MCEDCKGCAGCTCGDDVHHSGAERDRYDIVIVTSGGKLHSVYAPTAGRSLRIYELNELSSHEVIHLAAELASDYVCVREVNDDDAE